MKLDIPFQSQQGNSTRNDCGAACIAMLTGATIAQVLAAVTHPPNRMMHVSDILDALRAYQLPRQHTTALTAELLRESLAQGWPVIALVDYGSLPTDLKATDYHGNHFVVVTGFYTSNGGGFYVHDPLWPGDAGAWLEWPEFAMLEALRSVRGAQPYQGVIVRQGRQIFATEAAEFGRVVSETLTNQVLLGYLSDIYFRLGIVAGSLEARQRHALATIAQLQKQ
jgi:hypothetical protein